ncbi:MAG: glycosyltransferase [Chthoniobacterales bacterium]
MDYRKAYGLPERYFLSLGRMVEKKNLSTLVEAYARFARASGERSKAETGNLNRSEAEIAEGKPELPETADGTAFTSAGTRHSSRVTRHTPVALVFVGSGELEGALREQARGRGLRVVDRTDWKAGLPDDETTGLQEHETKRRKDQEPSLRDGARRSRGQTEGLQKRTEVCKLTTDNATENDRGAVYFYGFRQIEENPVFYALAEAFVLPSLKEEWGLVVNEAMACSLPVIVSRTAGCAEDLLPGSGQVAGGEWRVTSKDADDRKPLTDDSLEERSNGFVFDPKSSDALSEALQRVADYGTTGLQDNGTNMLAQMGQRSREIVAKFSCENFARQALSAARAAQQA